MNVSDIIIISLISIWIGIAIVYSLSRKKKSGCCHCCDKCKELCKNSHINKENITVLTAPDTTKTGDIYGYHNKFRKD